jgi:hypothetical protein
MLGGKRREVVQPALVRVTNERDLGVRWKDVTIEGIGLE